MAVTITKKASKVTKAKAKDKEPKRQLGKVNGLTIRETWKKLFADNEKCPKAQRLTDEKILAQMNKEFPGRTSREFTQLSAVQTLRAAYNRGHFHEGSAPAVKSNRYLPGGEIDNRGRRFSGGRELKPGEKEQRKPDAAPKAKAKAKAKPKAKAPVKVRHAGTKPGAAPAKSGKIVISVKKPATTLPPP